jgi:hypothetical protein
MRVLRYLSRYGLANLRCQWTPNDAAVQQPKSSIKWEQTSNQPVVKVKLQHYLSPTLDLNLPALQSLCPLQL